MANATVKVTNCRVIWPDLFQPRKIDPTNNEEVPKYALTLLLDKNTAEGKANISRVREGIKAVAAAAWPSDPKALKADKQPMRDGDNEDMNETYRGYIVVRSSSRRAPIVVDRNRSQLNPSHGRPAGGDYCNVVLGMYSSDHKMGKFVSAGLEAVQFVAAGEPLGGRSAVDPNECFDDLSAQTAGASGDSAQDDASPWD